MARRFSDWEKSAYDSLRNSDNFAVAITPMVLAGGLARYPGAKAFLAKRLRESISDGPTDAAD